MQLTVISESADSTAHHGRELVYSTAIVRTLVFQFSWSSTGRPISGDLVKAYVSSVYDDVNHNVPEHVLQVQGNEEEDATVCMKF